MGKFKEGDRVICMQGGFISIKGEMYEVVNAAHPKSNFLGKRKKGGAGTPFWSFNRNFKLLAMNRNNANEVASLQGANE